MKRLLGFALALIFFAGTASAAPLDAFKGQKGTLDIAGGTAHIPVMKAAAKSNYRNSVLTFRMKESLLTAMLSRPIVPKQRRMLPLNY